MDNKEQSQKKSWLRSPMFLVLCGFLIIAAFFLFTEHRAHVFGILPFVLLLVLLLLCPILHFLMHGKHGGHGGGDGGHAGDVDGQKHDHGGEQ
jgi:cell division protein FtsW (lipid II flippase)